MSATEQLIDVAHWKNAAFFMIEEHIGSSYVLTYMINTELINHVASNFFIQDPSLTSDRC